MGEDTALALGAALDYAFRDATLAETALSHPSFAHELDGSRGNERLEFLGDAVLDLVVARLLYDRHPEWPEGELTRARASLVNKDALADRARALGLGGLIRLGKTEQRSAGNEKDSILSNCFEAVIGAVYLDGGLEPVERAVQHLFGEELGNEAVLRDAKTAFQEWAHAEYQCTPLYETTHDTGVENDDGRFTVEVHLRDTVYGAGVGRTKRAAERRAAREALSRGRSE